MTDIQKQLAEVLEALVEGHDMGGLMSDADAWKDARAILAAYRQQEARKPLTREQIAKALADAGLKAEDYPEDMLIEPLVWAIEAAHGIKGE